MQTKTITDEAVDFAPLLRALEEGSMEEQLAARRELKRLGPSAVAPLLAELEAAHRRYGNKNGGWSSWFRARRRHQIGLPVLGVVLAATVICTVLEAVVVHLLPIDHHTKVTITLVCFVGICAIGLMLSLSVRPFLRWMIKPMARRPERVVFPEIRPVADALEIALRETRRRSEEVNASELRGPMLKALVLSATPTSPCFDERVALPLLDTLAVIGNGTALPALYTLRDAPDEQWGITQYAGTQIRASVRRCIETIESRLAAALPGKTLLRSSALPPEEQPLLRPVAGNGESETQALLRPTADDAPQVDTQEARP